MRETDGYLWGNGSEKKTVILCVYKGVVSVEGRKAKTVLWYWSVRID
jgi:hypothetical protein